MTFIKYNEKLYSHIFRQVGKDGYLPLSHSDRGRLRCVDVGEEHSSILGRSLVYSMLNSRLNLSI